MIDKLIKMLNMVIAYNTMLCFDKSNFLSPEKAEQMTCGICNGIFRDPIIDPCGHIFGRSCYLEFVKQNSKCPISLNSIDKDTNVMPCDPVRNFVSKLQVKCFCNSECHWTGILDSFDQHINSECGFELSVCPNPKCDYRIIRKDFDSSHKDMCVYRMDECNNCNETIQFTKISRHLIDCFKNNIKCPQNCLKVLKREELTRHIAQDCEMRIVSCELKNIGCIYSGSFKDVTEHQTSPYTYKSHLNLIMVASKNRSKDLALIPKIYDKFMNMEENVQDLTKSLALQKFELSSMGSKVDSIKAEKLRKDTEDSIKLERIKETIEKSILASAIDNNKEIDLKCSETSSAIDYQFNRILEQFTAKFEIQFSLLKSDIAKSNAIKEANSISVYFDNYCKSSKIYLRSSSEAVYKSSIFRDYLYTNLGGYALLSSSIIPNKSYKILVLKQISQKMAIGICLKPMLQKNNFEISLHKWPDSYLFFADGACKLQNPGEFIKNSGNGMTFKSNDILELVLDSSTRSLTCRNLTTNKASKIDIKISESILNMYPCIRLRKPNEAVKIT
jgi:hypothetical protein